MFELMLKNEGLNQQAFQVLKSAVCRRLAERECALSEPGLEVVLMVDGQMQEDEYRVEANSRRVCVVSGGVSGSFAGVGDYLRKSAFDGRGGCTPFEGTLALRPDNPIHGMYFATHFQNFYEAAPLDQVRSIIEDLALCGCNALMVWYDMHQFTDVDTPDSLAMIARLKAMLRHAAAVGMKTVFTTLSNESFSNSPENLRAEWAEQNGYFKSPEGHYHVEICPNREGGMEEILRQRRRVMEAFSDVRLDYISVWPYDQGGCTCNKCAPWGANGFLKTLDALCELYAEVVPNSRVLCSTWFFDRFVKGEWDAFNRAVNKKMNPRVEYLFGYFANDERVPEFIREGNMPAGKRMIAFPEISMYGALPWGGFGANPMPGRMEENYRENGGLYCGALPYSEGIFEDINKELMLAFYSGRSNSAEEVLREYARFELCLNGELEDAFVQMVQGMEETLNRAETDGVGMRVPWQRTVEHAYEEIRFIIEKPDRAAEVEALAERIDAFLPKRIRTGWRWRVLRLRARIDAELCAHDMHFSEKFEESMEELKRIYSADHAYFVVTPLTRAAVRDVLGGVV